MARRRYPGRSTVTVSTSHYDEETDVETDIDVECTVSPEERDTGCGAEVEILSAEGSDGKDYREAIESDAGWFDRVYVDAVEASLEYDGPDTTEEARGER